MRKIILMALTLVAVAGSTTPALAQGKKTAAQARTKAAPPAPLPLGRVEFPPFAERTLSNGAQLVVVEHHEQPVVSVNIYIRGAGSTADTDAKVGVASFTSALIRSGTKSKTSKEIAEAVESLGASFSSGVSDDWAQLSATMLKNDIDAVLAVMADALLNPIFPADELETQRRRMLTSLQVALSRPATVAQRQFEMSVFGAHPYGRQTTTTGLRAITREDLVAFHQAKYKPSNALIVVAGDVDASQIAAKLEQHLGAWTGTGSARPQFAAAPVRTQPEIILVNKPGAVQANFRIGHTIVPASHADWPALRIAEVILGGGPKSWLHLTLREDKGFTYAAAAESSRRLDPGYFQLWGDIRNEVADSALELFIATARKLRDAPVPAADFELAKSRLIGIFPLAIETPAQIASQAASARLLGQPKDFLQTWRTRLAAVTPADVQRVARQHIHPENAVIIVAGDASVLKPKLDRFGKITVVDEEGRPIAQEAPGAKPAPAAAVDVSSLKPMTLVYTINFQGNPAAELTRVVSRETAGGQDIVKITGTTSGMMTGSSELKIDAKTFAPISSNLQQQRGGMSSSSMLSVSGGKITGMLTTPQSPDPQMVDADFPAGTLLGAVGMEEAAMWLVDFTTTKEVKLNVFNAQTRSLVPFTVKLVGEGKQKVAAGEFEVYELDVTTPQGGAKAYVRKAAPHILIKQEPLAQPVMIELKSIKE